MSLEQFHMPDELWVRIVYDFALAHRLRTINRDHLLRSMTPLYLAWVASYARDLETAVAAALEQRLERYVSAYESGKALSCVPMALAGPVQPLVLCSL